MTCTSAKQKKLPQAGFDYPQLAPLLASTAKAHDNLVVPAESTLLERLYAELRGTMRQVLDHLGLAA